MKKLLYILLFGFLVIKPNRRKPPNFSQFQRILFKDLADTIEKTIPVKIYYANKWVDSLFLNIKSE